MDQGTDITTAAAMLSHSNTATIGTYLDARAGRVDQARERVRRIITLDKRTPESPA